MNERGNKSVAMRSCRKHCQEEEIGRREKRDEWRWRDSGIKKKGRIELFAVKSCIPARLATRPDVEAHCFIAICTIKYITVLQPRYCIVNIDDHRSYCPLPRGTFTKRSTTSLKLHLPLSPPSLSFALASVSRFWLTHARLRHVSACGKLIPSGLKTTLKKSDVPKKRKWKKGNECSDWPF